MDVSALTRQSSGTWREELAADYETSQARLSWMLSGEDASEEFI